MTKIYRPCVRENTLSEGTGNIVLEGAMRRSLPFAGVMEEGDTCDIVVSYDNVFTEVEVEMNADGELVRGHVWLTLHADGTIDQEPLVIPPGMKTVIMTVAADSAATTYNTIRFDIEQSLTSIQKALFVANLGRLPAEPGTEMLFRQTAAPLGWTKRTTYTDYALRVVSGTAGSGGSLGFATVFALNATDPHTLTAAQQAIITPVFTGIQQTKALDQGGIPFNAAFTTLAGGGSGSIVTNDVGVVTVTFTPGGSIAAIGGGQSHQHGMDMRLKYLDTIIAIKD